MTSKTEARAKVLSEINKEYGAGTIMVMSDHTATHVEALTTGSIGLDIALGVGGYPRGRIVEIFGNEASGKSTMCLHAVAEAQRNGGTAAYIDAEHALDIAYASNLGVDVDELVLSQPENGEQALEIVEKLVSSNAFDIIVVDSVAALVPKAEIEGEMGQSHMGLQARLMSQALRKLTALVAKSKTILIFINQIRQKIGVLYGPNTTTTGGNALKFYCSVRLELHKAEAIKDGDAVIGNRTRVKVVKNKVSPPHRVAEFDIIFGKGVNKLGEILDFGVQLNVIEKSGAWYSLDGERMGQGRDAALEYLRNSPKASGLVEETIRTHYRLSNAKEE